jgi:hypothetical protein
VRGERVRPHDEKAHAGVGERHEQVMEVGNHVLPAWSLRVATTIGMVARV